MVETDSISCWNVDFKIIIMTVSICRTDIHSCGYVDVHNSWWNPQ